MAGAVRRICMTYLPVQTRSDGASLARDQCSRSSGDYAELNSYEMFSDGSWRK